MNRPRLLGLISKGHIIIHQGFFFFLRRDRINHTIIHANQLLFSIVRGKIRNLRPSKESPSVIPMRLLFFFFPTQCYSGAEIIWLKWLDKKNGEMSDRNPWRLPPSKMICHFFCAKRLWLWLMPLCPGGTAVKMLHSYSFYSSRSSPDSDRAAAARAIGLHVSHHPAQHQLHRGGRTGHPAGNPVPRQPFHADRDPRRRVTHLQGVASGAGHRVPHQCPAHPAGGGRHGGSGAAAHQQDKVCRWVGSRLKSLLPV